MSQFFTTMQAEVAKEDSSSYTQTQRAQLQPLFAGRHELITLLARSDPASADRLTDLFVACRKMTSGDEDSLVLFKILLDHFAPDLLG